MTARVAFACALATVVLIWFAIFAAPLSAHQAAARQGYDNLFTFRATA